jgi:hypothetical protein
MLAKSTAARRLQCSASDDYAELEATVGSQATPAGLLQALAVLFNPLGRDFKDLKLGLFLKIINRETV